MAGDKDVVVVRKGAQGRRRTRESMEARVTPGGLRLVDALDDMIDARFPNRQALLDALGAKARSAGLDRKKLSKQMGGPTKPHGPDWAVVTLVVEGCSADPAERARDLARLAGLFCVARDVPRPDDSYCGEIAWPADMNDQCSAGVAHLRQQNDALRRQAAVLAAHATCREAEMARLETENSRLSQEVMGFSVQLLLGREELDKTRHELDMTRNAAEIERYTTDKLIVEQAARNNQNLRERCARMAAQLELPIQHWRGNGLPDSAVVYRAGRSDNAGLIVDPMARPAWRALAAYLLIHYEYSGRGLSELAQALTVPIGHLHNMLTAQVLPSPQILTALAKAIDADIFQARQLYDDATEVCSGPFDSRPRSIHHLTHTPSFPHVDHYVSVISDRRGDNASPLGPAEALTNAAVATAPGDSDSSDPTEEIGGAGRATVSPDSGDTLADGHTATGEHEPAFTSNPQNMITLHDVGRLLWSGVKTWRPMYRRRHSPRRGPGPHPH